MGLFQRTIEFNTTTIPTESEIKMAYESMHGQELQIVSRKITSEMIAKFEWAKKNGLVEPSDQAYLKSGEFYVNGEEICEFKKYQHKYVLTYYNSDKKSRKNGDAIFQVLESLKNEF